MNELTRSRWRADAQAESAAVARGGGLLCLWRGRPHRRRHHRRHRDLAAQQCAQVSYLETATWRSAARERAHNAM
jgi:hypothetical protein